MGSMLKHKLLTTSLLACGGHPDTCTHTWREYLDSLFFWQRCHLMAKVDVASLSALCSLPHLLLPRSITSPSGMYNLKGIPCDFSYLSLID